MRTKTTIEKNKKATSLKMKSIIFILLAILGIIAELNAQNVPSYIPTNGLVGWWPFNGNANDESGNGNDGTVNGATLTTDRFGIQNHCYNFDGTTNYILITNSLLPANATSYSISMWINPNIFFNNYSELMCDRGTLTYAHKYRIGTSDNGAQLQPGTFYCLMGDGFGETHCYDTTYLNLNLWSHYTVVYNSILGEMRAYKNGNLTDVNLSSGSGGGYPNQTTPTYIGKSISPSGLDFGFHGLIDDIGVWNRALTPQEITALYTASNNNNATSNTTANVPGAISYQAVARDAQGMPLADANLQVQFTLIADSLSGAAEYVETHTLTTNSLGLFTTALGAGTPVSNNFGNINWSAGNKFLKVQIDTGNGWMDMGTQQLLSTPYSMHSATSGTIKNPGLPVFTDNAAALAGGLVAGDMYRTASGDLKIVY
jgi:hypothetical protein